MFARAGELLSGVPTADPKRYTLPPSHRLGGRLAFRAVFDAGQKASKGPLTAYVRPNGLGHPRLGLTVPRRVGNAVARNRVKRMLREAYRHLRHDFPVDYDFVVVVRPHPALTLAEYQAMMVRLSEKVHAKADQAAGSQRGPDPASGTASTEVGPGPRCDPA